MGQTKPGSEHRMKIVVLLFITALTIQSMESNGDCPRRAVKLSQGVRMICKKGEWKALVKNRKGKISSPPCEDNPSVPAGSCSVDAGHCHQNTEDGARMERDCAGTCDTCDSCRCQDSTQWFKYCPYWSQYCASPGVLGVWMTENCRKTCNKCKCNCCSYKGKKHGLGARIPIPDKCGELLCQEGLMAEDSPLLPGASHHNISHPEELTLVFKSMFPGSHCCILPADAQEKDGNIARNQSMVEEGWTGKVVKDGVTLEATCCHGVLSVPLQDSVFVKLSLSTTTPTTTTSTTTTTTTLTTTTTMTSTTKTTRVFKKEQEFQLSRNQLLGELAVLGTEYSITFQLFLTSYDSGIIIHFTLGGLGGLGGNQGKYGDRTPFLYTHTEGNFYLFSAIDGNPNYYWKTPLPTLNTWHTMEISQLSEGSEIVFKMKVDGAVVANKENNDPRSFQKIQMFAGSNFWSAAKGRIRNLVVKTMI